MPQEHKLEDAKVGDTKERVTPFWKAVVVLSTLTGILLAMNQVFFWQIGGDSLLTKSFLYYTLAAFLPIVFIVVPIRRSHSGRKLPSYDVLLALLALIVCLYFGYNAESIITYGWTFNAPEVATTFSFILWALTLETLRRTAGWIVTVIAFSFSVYPLFANLIPFTMLRGISFDIDATARNHVMGDDAILGLPMQMAASLLVGFLLFGVVLRYSGGGQFFLDVSRSLLGARRGGSAKVAIVSSGFMGMMSGSAISNVLTTGPMTIPAMVKDRFSRRYAAAIEATASTGGTVAPPLMGSAAFLMVAFLGIPYSEVALAAAIPAILYFLGIFVQVDAYSGSQGMRGMQKSALPRLGRTLLTGWPYLGALVGLVILLAVMGNERQAPYWIIGGLIIVQASKAVAKRDSRSIPGMLIEYTYAAGRTIAEIIGILAGVGLIVGGLSMTGASLSLASEMVSALGGSTIAILIAGALAAFVLGLGMTVTAVYVFLAIVLVPALVQLGVDPVAAHLFVIYWGTVSYITPPVALAAFAASGIAQSSPMATAFTAMRLGSVKYLIPFAFVLNPALVWQGSGGSIALSFALAVLGVFFLGMAFEGWVIGVNRRPTVYARILLILSAVATFVPVPEVSVTGVVFGLGVSVMTRRWHVSRGKRPHEPREDVDDEVVSVRGQHEAHKN